MADTGNPTQARTFAVGDVLARSFAIWAKNFIPFGVISLLVNAPLILLNFVAYGGMSPTVAVAYVSVIGLLSMALGLVATGAITYGVVMQMRGQPAGMGKAISVGLSRVLAVIGVAAIIALMIIVPVVLLVFISPTLAAFVGAVVAAIVFLVYWVAVPAAVVEKTGVGASLSRSAALTSGSRFAIFLLWLVLAILGGIFNYVLQSILQSLPPMMLLFVSTAIQAFFISALGAVVNAVGYQTLRTSKEGASLEDIAKVFD